MDQDDELKELREKFAIISRKADLFEGAFLALSNYNQHQVDQRHEVGKVCPSCQTLRVNIQKYYGPLKSEGFLK